LRFDFVSLHRGVCTPALRYVWFRSFLLAVFAVAGFAFAFFFFLTITRTRLWWSRLRYLVEHVWVPRFIRSLLTFRCCLRFAVDFCLLRYFVGSFGPTSYSRTLPRRALCTAGHGFGCTTWTVQFVRGLEYLPLHDGVCRFLYAFQFRWQHLLHARIYADI